MANLLKKYGIGLESENTETTEEAVDMTGENLGSVADQVRRRLEAQRAAREEEQAEEAEETQEEQTEETAEEETPAEEPEAEESAEEESSEEDKEEEATEESEESDEKSEEAEEDAEKAEGEAEEAEVDAELSEEEKEGVKAELEAFKVLLNKAYMEGGLSVENASVVEPALTHLFAKAGFKDHIVVPSVEHFNAGSQAMIATGLILDRIDNALESMK